MLFADVILPVPLQGTFTYSVPATLQGVLQPGSRVTVTFGRSKKYVGIVRRLHNNQPSFKTKPIVKMLDQHPMVLTEQLDMWDWIATYYMSSIGEVFAAAMPGGLKGEDRYHALTEQCVTLGEKYRSEQDLHLALDMLHRAAQQRKAFETFLHLSHWDTINGTATDEPIAEVTREELLNASGASVATVRALQDRQMLHLYDREVPRLNLTGEAHPEQVKHLSPAQQKAFNGIVEQHKQKDVVLLHGVTSSGKTEIYIHLIMKALEQHRQVLYLVPEIALTVQLMMRLRKVFGPRLGIYHSRYSDEERVEVWQKQLSDEPYDVILGVRSAVFLPFHRLGMIILDEEHESSFKQQDPAPRYHARSVAIVMAQKCGAKVLLGTATPSAETYYNATEAHKYGLVRLTTRYQDIQLPRIEVVDVKDLRRRKIMKGPLSPPLLEAMHGALSQGKQVILFQNRRGFAPMIECANCGWVPRCKNCDVPLTYHKRLNLLTCHYCGYAYAIPNQCPNCEEHDLRNRGIGTEKLEELVAEQFPEARIARMDLDTTRTRNAHERIISDFSACRTNVLIGTQMITKGLDFDNVSVVGIVDADGMLNYPDFRAYEHAFNMMAQVAGRAGRKGQQGLVMLQTRNAELPVVQCLQRNDFQAFFRLLMEERQMFKYPPFHRLIYIFLRHQKEPLAERAAQQMATLLRPIFGSAVLGPDKPSVSRIKQMSIRKIVLKLDRRLSQQRIRQHLRQAEASLMANKEFAALKLYFDVDPE